MPTGHSEGLPKSGSPRRGLKGEEGDVRGRSPSAGRQPQPDWLTQDQAGAWCPDPGRWYPSCTGRVCCMLGRGGYLLSSLPLPVPLALNLSPQPRGPRLQGESTGSSRGGAGRGGVGVREDTACTSARARARTQGSQQPPLSAPAWASDQVATAPHLPLKVASSASHVASLSLDFLMCQKKGGGRNLTYMVFPAVLLWGSYQTGLSNDEGCRPGFAGLDPCPRVSPELQNPH